MNEKKITPATSQLKFVDEQYIWRFSPNQTDPELLEEIFVGREELLQNVLEKVAESATSKARHHVLLTGPRGIGKTHFVTLLRYRINNDQQLRDKIRIAKLGEDETVTNVTQLLERIYRALCKEYPAEFSSAWLEDLMQKEPEEIDEGLKQQLIERFKQKTLIILIENLSHLFDYLGKKGQQELRSFLQEHPIACLIASSQQLFKEVTDRSEPFFGFFQVKNLKPLSFEDARNLLIKIAKSKGQVELAAFLQTPDGRSRVRAIHDLAGGNHRVYIVLSGFITRESIDQLVEPFKKMADDLTPYYQERLRWISPQQRQIVELLCRERRTLTPKEIAKRLIVRENTVGSQVKKLVNIGYVTSIKRGRESFYDLSEPLMRLAYEVKEQSLLIMLVDFLRIWYRPEQMLHLREKCYSMNTRQYMDAAILRAKSHPDPRLDVLNKEIERAKEEGRLDEIAETWEEKAHVSGDKVAWFIAGYYFDVFKKDHIKAIECLDRALELDPEDTYAWNKKGSLLDDMERYEEALQCYDRALKIDPEFVNAWNSKGYSLDNMGRYEEALQCYDRALKIDPEFVNAWNSKGYSLDNMGRYEEALQCYERALTLDPECVYAWNNKGYSLGNMERYEEALECYDRALKIDPEFVNAWNNKGSSLNNMGRYEEALQCYDRALDIEPHDPCPLFNRVEALFVMNRWEEGFESLRNAFVKKQTSEQYYGDVDSMLGLIFRLSQSESILQERINLLVNIYEEATFKLNDKKENEHILKGPMECLADELVKSLKKIDHERVTSQVMESYVRAVENRVGKIPEFEVALRLFKYGIKYLISHDPAEFVEIVQPESNILLELFDLKK